jgi:hypothetical protein
MPRIFCDVFDNTAFPNEVLNRKERALKEAIDNYTPFYQRVKPLVVSTESLEKTLRTNSQYLMNFHRYIVHIEHVELRPLTESIQARTQNRNPIYRYILNYINRDLLADELIRTDTTTMKDRAYLDILDALVMVGKQILIDCMVELQAARHAQCLELYSKFDYHNNAAEYLNPKFISQFVICEPYFPCEKMAEQFANLVKITDKYVLAIRRYCAYSSIEALKFLLIYNSKKSLPLWNYFEGKTSWRGFQNKTEIQTEIKLHKEQLEEMDRKDEASSTGGGSSMVASSSIGGEGLSVASSLGEGLQNTFV